MKRVAASAFVWFLLLLVPAIARAQFSFAAPVSYPITPQVQIRGVVSTPLVAADLNGDGRADVVLATPDDVRVYMNRGDGTLATPVIYGSGGGPIVAVDLNGDGHIDLAFGTSSGAGSPIGVLLNNGDGTFDGPTYYHCGGNIGADWITVGDFRHTGRRADLALLTNGFFGGGPKLTTFDNNGDGTFTCGPTLSPDPLLGSAMAVQAVDLNSDGYDDLIVSSFNSGPDFRVYLNTAGSFVTATDYSPTGALCAGLQVADLNHDGLMDIVRYNCNVLYAIDPLLNNGDGTSTSAPTFTDGYFHTRPLISQILAIADVDGDNRPDLVADAGPAAGPPQLALYQNTGNNAFGPPALQDGGTFPVGGNPTFVRGQLFGIAIADLDGNGSPDVVTLQDTSDSNGSPTETYTLNVVLNQVHFSTDTTPPTTTASPSPQPNTAGWNNTSVAVLLQAKDNQGGSGVRSIQYALSGAEAAGSTIVSAASTTFILSAEGSTTISYSATDQAGNQEAANALVVDIDLTPPTISGRQTPAANQNGWNNTPVTVTFSCSDALSGIASCSGSATLTGDGQGRSVVGGAADVAGNSNTATVSGINIDRTPPVITFTGNAGVYAVDQTVNITCWSSDALSGIASATCPGATGPAYTFAVGPNPLLATATDRAGNQSTRSTTFTVMITFESLGNLTRRFASKAGIADSLVAKLSAAAAAAARSDRAALDGTLQAYRNELSAQSGKSLTVSQVLILQKLSMAF